MFPKGNQQEPDSVSRLSNLNALGKFAPTQNRTVLIEKVYKTICIKPPTLDWNALMLHKELQ